MPSSSVRSVSAWSPKPLLWFSVRAKQSYMNSHRCSADNSWLSGKSSPPNFCIFPSCRLSQGHFHLKISLYFWKKLLGGSFSGLIAIPPASTWSRARNSVFRGPPQLRSRLSPLGIQGLLPKLLHQVRLHTEALELCVMALDIWCRSVPSRPSFFVAREDQGGQQQTRASVNLAACRSDGGR